MLKLLEKVASIPLLYVNSQHKYTAKGCENSVRVYASKLICNINAFICNDYLSFSVVESVFDSDVVVAAAFSKAHQRFCNSSYRQFSSASLSSISRHFSETFFKIFLYFTLLKLRLHTAIYRADFVSW